MSKAEKQEKRVFLLRERNECAEWRGTVYLPRQHTVAMDKKTRLPHTSVRGATLRKRNRLHGSAFPCHSHIAQDSAVRTSMT